MTTFQTPPRTTTTPTIRTRRPTSSPTTRRVLIVTLGLVVLGVVILGLLALVPSLRAGDLPGAEGLPGVGSADEGAEDRSVPDDPRLRDTQVDPFDDDHPAIAGLDPQVRDALQEAARDAGAQGIELFWVTSGRRTAAYQEELFDRAVERYGSDEEARRFVASPESSSHVTGEAVDIGPTDAADWMVRKGAAYGLCQTFANEMWHFELATEPGGTCPQPLPDANG
ncbi:M15 family metallopeptidase [Oerskovia flava]|uniref:M15 family metallopeptidase n=1 Tax=Oerskovia flava TaxID=2986422 RepID=UPI00223F0627|nr:M15 family metallopeptidase [Oerskovia sp. JB1-3-2]